MKIVDYTAPAGANNQVTVANNAAFVRVHGLIPAGTPIAFRLSELGNVNSDGFYSVTNNTLPSSQGLIVKTRGATPGIADQILPTTGGTIAADGVVSANVHTIDTTSFLHGYNVVTGNWDRVQLTAGALNTTAKIDGVYAAVTNTDPANIGNIFHTRATTPDDTNQIFRSTGAVANADNINPATVFGQDSNSFLHGYDATGANWDRVQIYAGRLGVSIADEAGVAFSTTNPLPVTFTDSEGVEVNNYLQSVAVAAAGSVNHDYTITALYTGKLSRVRAAASGKMKVTVQVETGVATNVFTNLFTGFNSTANPNVDFDINEHVTAVAGARIRVVRSNLDLLAQDLYSTICIHETL